MKSLTQILLVNFIIHLVFAFSLNIIRPDYIEFIVCVEAWFVVLYFDMVCMTLAHPQMNYHVSQFGYWNQEIAVM